MSLDRARGLDIRPDILGVAPEEMRRLGYLVVDAVVDRLTTLEGQPAIVESSRSSLEAALGGPVPIDGTDIHESLDLLVNVALRNQQNGDHPRYFARVPGPSSFVGILGDWMATGMQAIASSWGGGSGPTAVELIACGWLRDALGLAPSNEGILVSGGSMANVTAAIAARVHSGPGVVYLSDQTHASIARGLLSVGQLPENIRVIECDEFYRMSTDSLRETLQADAAKGLRASMVIATAGTTNTGAVDELAKISELCRSYDAWMHVDAAYGGPAALCPSGRESLAGLDLADSLSVDPHKWLFQPYDIACLFVQRPGALENAFAMHPEYLVDVAGREVDLHNRGLELTRRGRAVKLWLTFRTYGLETLADAVERGIALGESAQLAIEQIASLEVVTPAQLGIVTFAGRTRNDADHARAARLLNESGFAAVSSTRLAGRTVLRLCTINPRTTQADIDETVRRLAMYLGETDR